MARKPDTPCAGCGKLLWGGTTSKPAGERMCRQCRTSGPSQPPVAQTSPQFPADSDRSAQLETIRAKLATELATAEGKDTAPIARALIEVMREIQAGTKPATEQPKKVGGVISLAAEAAKRRSPSAG